MSFRLVPESMILNDLERHNGRYFALFQRIRVVSGAHCVKVYLRYLISWWVLVEIYIRCIKVCVCAVERLLKSILFKFCFWIKRKNSGLFKSEYCAWLQKLLLCDVNFSYFDFEHSDGDLWCRFQSLFARRFCLRRRIEFTQNFEFCTHLSHPKCRGSNYHWMSTEWDWSPRLDGFDLLEM